MVGARLVERGQLVAALDRAVTRRVTLISAPAGSGKTSLLRAWAARPFQTHQVAFLSVRRDQNDEQLFWLALLQAIRNIVGRSDADDGYANGDAENEWPSMQLQVRGMQQSVL